MMNEQLEKIWDKARDEVEQTNPQSWKIVDVREKFAELIIKECLNVMDATAKKAQEQFTYMGDDVPTFRHQIEIKKHFGVEQ